MFYIKFVGEKPCNISKEVGIDVNNKASAEAILTRHFREPCTILFIDCLDDTSKYDTIIRVGKHGRYEAFTNFIQTLKA